MLQNVLILQFASLKNKNLVFGVNFGQFANTLLESIDCLFNRSFDYKLFPLEIDTNIYLRWACSPLLKALNMQNGIMSDAQLGQTHRYVFEGMSFEDQTVVVRQLEVTMCQSTCQFADLLGTLQIEGAAVAVVEPQVDSQSSFLVIGHIAKINQQVSSNQQTQSLLVYAPKSEESLCSLRLPESQTVPRVSGIAVIFFAGWDGMFPFVSTLSLQQEQGPPRQQGFQLSFLSFELHDGTRPQAQRHDRLIEQNRVVDVGANALSRFVFIDNQCIELGILRQKMLLFKMVFYLFLDLQELERDGLGRGERIFVRVRIIPSIMLSSSLETRTPLEAFDGSNQFIFLSWRDEARKQFQAGNICLFQH